MAGDLRSNAANHPDDGDERAIDWDFVYDEHAARIRRIIERRAGTSMADDLLQETFERALRGESRFDLDRPMAPWLNTIAFHLTSDLRRKQTAAGEVLVDEPPDVVGPDVAEESYVARVRRMGIRQAFESLSHRHRRVLQLIAVEGMTSEEVAEFEHMSTEAVKSVLARARVNFRANYTEFVEKMGVFGGAVVGPMVLRLRARFERYADVATNHAGAITIAAAATAMLGAASVPATRPVFTAAYEEPVVTVVTQTSTGISIDAGNDESVETSGDDAVAMGTRLSPDPAAPRPGSSDTGVDVTATVSRTNNSAGMGASSKEEGPTSSHTWATVDIPDCNATLTTQVVCGAMDASEEAGVTP